MATTTQASGIARPTGDESPVIAELRGLKGQRSPREPRIAKAVEILKQANSARVRNAAALALADMRAQNAKEPLISLLTRPETKGARGTLLYALEQLRADVPIAILAEIIATESYEAREEALGFIVRGRIDSSMPDLARARGTLETARAEADSERAGAIRKALEHMQQ